MGRIEIETEIEAPIEKVFAFYADPKNMEKTSAEDAEVKIEKLYEGPARVGAAFRLSGVVAGRKLDLKIEMVELEENRRFVGRQTKGDMKRMEVTTVFEATDRGTKVTETWDYELPYSVLGKLLDKLKARKDMERYIKAGAEKTKEILEKG